MGDRGKEGGKEMKGEKELEKRDGGSSRKERGRGKEWEAGEGENKTRINIQKEKRQ